MRDSPRVVYPVLVIRKFFLCVAARAVGQSWDLLESSSARDVAAGGVAGVAGAAQA